MPRPNDLVKIVLNGKTLSQKFTYKYAKIFQKSNPDAVIVDANGGTEKIEPIQQTQKKNVEPVSEAVEKEEKKENKSKKPGRPTKKSK